MFRTNFIALGLTALTVFGASTALAAGNWADGVPSTVWAGYTDGAVYISGLKDIQGCTGTTIKITRDTDKVMSLALAAFLSGQKLECNVDPDKAKCIVQGEYQYQMGYQCRIVR